MLGRAKIACLGGDARSLSMMRRLAVLGADVHALGAPRCDEEAWWTEAATLNGALEGSRAVILPMPAFDHNEKLYCPLSEQTTDVCAYELFARIGGRMPVFGGRISPSVAALADQHGVTLTDYARLDELQIRNAVPTAEGAICLAMQTLDITLDGAHVAILGYGRIGVALSERLRVLGAQVTVAARKERDVTRIQCAHCRAIHLTGEDSLTPLTAGYDVIFNTIPHRLLTPRVLEAMPPKTVLVELASAPGGWDADAAIPCRSIYAPGLPGKYAPKTAGVIVADTLLPMLEEVIKA